MRKIILVVATLAGCAGGRSQFRDTSGFPVPTYAAIDSPYRKVELHCGAERYFIVDSPQVGVAGSRGLFATPRDLWSLDPDAICTNISVYGE